MVCSSDPDSNAFRKSSPALWHVLHTLTFFSELRRTQRVTAELMSVRFDSVRVAERHNKEQNNVSRVGRKVVCQLLIFSTLHRTLI